MQVLTYQCDICHLRAENDKAAMWGKLNDAYGGISQVCHECLAHLETRKKVHAQ